METLLAVMLVIFLLSVFVDLCRSNTYQVFVLRVVGEAVICGFIYVMLHFLIKYW